MSVYGYGRVSTRIQVDEGESLGVQQRQIAGYAMMHGWEIEHTYIEAGVSGSVAFAARPQGAALLAALKPGDVVVAAKLDRAFRDAGDALNTMKSLKARGIALHLIDLGGDVTSNGISKLVFTILAAVAEQERDRIIERITIVKQDQRARGRYLGGKVPFGFVAGAEGELQPVPEQQAVIETAKAMRPSSTLRAIQERVIELHGMKLSLDTISKIAA